MQNVNLIVVGRIKEKYFDAAVAEYVKRLGRYCRLTITEIKDEPIPENPSDREIELVLEKEAERIEAKIPKNAYLVPLCIEGKQIDSQGLADMIGSTATDGKGELTFIIGGSLGICERIKQRAGFKLSFSKMTFPHQLMRVVLLEQIYRAFNINNGGKYHK